MCIVLDTQSSSLHGKDNLQYVLWLCWHRQVSLGNSTRCADRNQGAVDLTNTLCFELLA